MGLCSSGNPSSLITFVPRPARLATPVGRPCGPLARDASAARSPDEDEDALRGCRTSRDSREQRVIPTTQPCAADPFVQHRDLMAHHHARRLSSSLRVGHFEPCEQGLQDGCGGEYRVSINDDCAYRVISLSVTSPIKLE